jgi:hypothetical protein
MGGTVYVGSLTVLKRSNASAPKTSFGGQLTMSWTGGHN